MSASDYGAILIKNGAIQNNNDKMFMDMMQSVGWADYPNIRYPDCSCTDEGVSYCSDCDKAIKEKFKSSDGQEWERTIADCKNNKIYIPGKINHNFFAYAGDEHFTVAVYKHLAVFFIDKVRVREVWGCDEEDKIKHKSVHLNIAGVDVHFKKITFNVDRCDFRYKNDSYTIVYGYGLDNDLSVWNRTKYTYMRNRDADKVDRIINKAQG